MAGEAWLGWLRFIAVLQGMFWSVWAGMVSQGMVSQGMVGSVLFWSVEARYGWRGKAGQRWVRYGTDWYGLAGEARSGKARWGVVG